ncbi:MAG: zinc-regulated TonB-dependent outer membrane receptor [Nitrospirota bacterium]
MLRSVFCLIVVLLFHPTVEAQIQQGEGMRPSLQGPNLDISLDGLFAAAYFSEPEHLNFGGHDPNQTGFTLQNLELTLGATVDPYARADAHIIYLIDEEGESILEIEEAYLTTLALPHRLQMIGGQFFTRFGRTNPIHPHAWNFADQPVINNRLLGPDGLRNPGVQLSWLSLLPFYLELIGSIQNAGGETAVSFLSNEEVFPKIFPDLKFEERDVRRFEDLLYMTRIKNSWTPTDTVEVVQGVSGLFGPNAGGEDTYTKVFGFDFYGKWRPLNAVGGFPFVAVQTEVMWSYETSEDPNDNLLDRGVYLQGLWGFTRRWVAGARVDYVNGGDDADPLRDRRWRLSPNLTFYPSEFSKWRLQYNVDRAEHLDDKPLHAVFLQFEFLIGSHGAHQF